MKPKRRVKEEATMNRIKFNKN